MRTPGAGSPVLADRDHERVHAVPLAGHLELGEDHGELGVRGGVADVVLVGLGLGRGDHELARVGVVRRDGAERLHVGAVAGLGHREAAHQLPGDQVGEVRLVVPLGAELEDRAAEQPELDADLDQHRQVAEGQGLERRERRADVAAAAVLLREAHPGLAGRGHLDHDLLDPLAERRPVEGLGLLEDRGVLGEVGAHQAADLGVLAVEQRGQRRDVDRRAGRSPPPRARAPRPGSPRPAARPRARWSRWPRREATAVAPSPRPAHGRAK